MAFAGLLVVPWNLDHLVNPTIFLAAHSHDKNKGFMITGIEAEAVLPVQKLHLFYKMMSVLEF